MRRLFIFFVLLILCAGLCACGSPKVEIIIEYDSGTAAEPEESPVPRLPLSPADMPEVSPAAKSAALPSIIKQPGGEKVEAGSRTWFISQAEGAEGMRWYFLPPDGGPELNISAAEERLPGLELEALDKGTLALRHIPAKMDGWAARAEFYNAGGSVFSDYAQISVVTPLELYEPILDNMRYIIDVYDNAVPYSAASDPYSLNSAFGFTGTDTAGYKLEDLDNNGVDELIIGYGDSSPEIAGIFTLRDNYPVVLGRSEGRAFLSYMGGASIYYSSGPGGPGTIIDTVYCVNGAHLDTLRCCYTYADGDGVLKSYYSEGTDVVNLSGRPEIESYRISDSEAEALHGEIRSSVSAVPLSGLIPFT